MFEREYREMGFINRWGIIRRIKEQSNAEHSWFVAVYAEQLATLLDWPGDRGVLLTAALYHDVDELPSGDIPGPTKRRAIHDPDSWREEMEQGVRRRFGGRVADILIAKRSGQLADVAAIIKVADSMDALFYLLTEKQMGNGTVKTLVENERKALYKHIHHMGEVLNADINKLVTMMSEIIANHLEGISITPDEKNV